MGEVAIVFSTALVTSIGSTQRTYQYLEGFQQWFRKFPSQHYRWVDNTIGSLESVDVRFEILRSRIGQVNTLLFEDNLYGSVNKGSGVLSQLHYLFSAGVLDGFSWVLFYEPRQTVLTWRTIGSLISSPETAFRVETPTKPPYLFRREHFLPNFYTGLFMLSTEDLREFVKSTPAEALARRGDSIERKLFEFVHERQISFRDIPILWVRRTLLGGGKEYR